jgi:hypothetical protein
MAAVLYTQFTTMPTGPRTHADYVTPSCGLVLTCRGEKYAQYKIIYSREYFHQGSLSAKIPDLGWAFSAKCEPHSTLVPCKKVHSANLTPL